MKKNCWEFKSCGRHNGGEKAADLGVCPASVYDKLDGIHGGRMAGRACWVIAGTICGGAIQGTFAQKYENCGQCDFYRAVKQEEGAGFHLSIVLLNRIKGV